MKRHNKNHGFTLVETLIAITILILAVTGAFAAAQNGISSAKFSKDQIVAFYLAQEGVEYIRNKRDSNALNPASTSWLDGVAEPGDPCFFGNKCMIDAITSVESDKIRVCSLQNGCPPLKLDNNGFYSYISGDDTKFTREITLEEIVPGVEVAITVTVRWSKGLVNREFVARENIFNWQ